MDIARIPVGGALVDALMRAGGVVVLLILLAKSRAASSPASTAEEVTLTAITA